MVAGIENLGEGLLKGYQFGLQQQRQQQQDARQATLDQQNQEQHNLSMQTNQFNLDQAKKKSALDEKTRARLDLGNKKASSAILLYKSGNPMEAFSSIADGYNSDPDAPYNIQVLGGRGDKDKETGESIFMGNVRYTDKKTGKVINEGELDFRHATSLYRDFFTGQGEFINNEQKRQEDIRKRALDLATKKDEEKRTQEYKLEQIRLERKLRPPEKPERPRYETVQDPVTGVYKRLNIETRDVEDFVQDDGLPLIGKTKNKFDGTYLYGLAEGSIRPMSKMQANSLANQMLSKVKVISTSRDPNVRKAAFNELIGQSKSFVMQTMPDATVQEIEQYTKEIAAQSFGNGSQSFEDIEKSINTPSNIKPKVSTPLLNANRAITPVNTQPQQPKIITGLNGGLTTKDKAVNSFLMGQ